MAVTFPFLRWVYQTCGPDTICCVLYPLWRLAPQLFNSARLVLQRIMRQLQQEVDVRSFDHAPMSTRSRIMLYRILRRRFIESSQLFGPEAREALPRRSETTDIARDLARLLELVDEKRDAGFDPATSMDEWGSPVYKESKDCAAQALPVNFRPKYSAVFSFTRVYACSKPECKRWQTGSVCLDVGAECLRLLRDMKRQLAAPGAGRDHAAMDTFIPSDEQLRSTSLSAICQVALRDLTRSDDVCPNCGARGKVHQLALPEILFVKFRQIVTDEWQTGSQVLPPRLSAWEQLSIDNDGQLRQYRLESLVFHAYPQNHYFGAHLWPGPGSVWVHSDSMGSGRAAVCQIGDGSSPSWRRQFPPTDEPYEADRRSCVLLAVFSSKQLRSRKRCSMQ